MRRVPRIAALAAAIAGVLGAYGLYLYASLPAVQLAHPDPHGGAGPASLAGPLLAGVAQMPAPPPTPAPVVDIRTGLWIEAASLRIQLPVRPGDGGNQIPYWTALTYPGTARPGSAGNSFIYAHGYWEMFGGLLYARVGDQVNLHNYDTGTLQSFHVSRVVGRVGYSDVSWIHAGSAIPLLTLQTCVDTNPAGDRFIVLATPD